MVFLLRILGQLYADWCAPIRKQACTDSIGGFPRIKKDSLKNSCSNKTWTPVRIYFLKTIFFKCMFSGKLRCTFILWGNLITRCVFLFHCIFRSSVCRLSCIWIYAAGVTRSQEDCLQSGCKGMWQHSLAVILCWKSKATIKLDKRPMAQDSKV